MTRCASSSNPDALFVDPGDATLNVQFAKRSLESRFNTYANLPSSSRVDDKENNSVDDSASRTSSHEEKTSLTTKSVIIGQGSPVKRGKATKSTPIKRRGSPFKQLGRWSDPNLFEDSFLKSAPLPSFANCGWPETPATLVFDVLNYAHVIGIMSPNVVFFDHGK